MAKKETLINRLDTIRANSVSPEEFKDTWGVSLDEHVKEMMDYMHEAEVKLKERIEARKVGELREIDDATLKKLMERANELSKMARKKGFVTSPEGKMVDFKDLLLRVNSKGEVVIEDASKQKEGMDVYRIDVFMNPGARKMGSKTPVPKKGKK